MKKVLRKTNLVAGILILLVVCLGIVLAGDVIVQEGDMDVENLNVKGDITPFASNQYYLGDSGLIWEQGWFNKVYTQATQPVFYLRHSSSDYFKIKYDSSDWLRIDQEGGDAGVKFRNKDNNEILTLDYLNERTGILTSSPSYPLEVNNNVSGISIWADADVSATGYITRTTVYDKSKGKALDFIQDADYYLTDNEIDHVKFYGYSGEYEIADYSKPEIYIDEFGEEITIYPKKTVKTVSLNKEVDVLRQAVYELKQENQTLKGEIAKLKKAVGID